MKTSELIDSAPLIDISPSTVEEKNEVDLDDRIFQEPTEEDSSLFGAFQILMNTAIGSGTLLIPFCYKLGIIFAILMSVIIGLISLGSFCMMMDAAYITKRYDFRGLWNQLFNKKLIFILDVIIFLVQIGSCMIYCHWVGLLVNRTLGIKVKVLNTDIFWNWATTLLLAFPMTIPRSIAKLETFASFGTVLIIVLISHALYWLIKDVKAKGFDPNHEIRWFHWDLSVFIPALGVNSMSYNCILNLFPTLEHLRNPTVRRGRYLAIINVCACFVAYAMFGIFTYLDKFNELKASSALELYPPSNPFTIIATICVCYILLLSEPLVIWAARTSVDATLFKDKEMTRLRWILTGLILIAISAGLASTSDNILIFFNIVGGLLIPVVTLLMPSLYFLKATPGRKWYRTVQAGYTIAFTIIAAVASTWQTVEEIIGKK
ncbi:Transmembrane amino acid transporter protein [Histomonas meleagridis]|uniref:Transmembrane amino acid transporter protein n=1 Tax=Histomonas meleagridis TaxID=135588 RepID=UPI00355A95BF|nr:Transmembrane amino acid transporter protein [Histomonas meleagridis]KAH0806857.1 Transmembrane amino acid transporter protein [Histomonas meleagridis]